MVILGLGSNVGDRIENLRRALHAIKEIIGVKVEKISPLYWSNALLPENAPPEWDMPHLNLAIRCAVDLQPDDLLRHLKNIEWSIGRKPEIRHWGPRILDIDILAWDQQIIRQNHLTIPHENLQTRPFALWPVADIAPFWQFPLPGENQGKTAAEMVEKWGSRFNGEAPLGTKQIYQRIDTPKLVGIVNVTPDSFSDGGRFVDVEAAINQAAYLVETGAEVIDVGAESTSPRVQPVTADQEWQRLQPILKALKETTKNFLIPPKISLDSRHYEVVEKALQYDIDIINDVSGLDDEKIRYIVKESKRDCIFMHHLSLPERRDHVLPRNENVVGLVYDWGKQRLHELMEFGIDQRQLIFDPGIGFGKMAEQSLVLLQHVEVFKSLNVPILIGHSRKTFLSLVSKEQFAERDIETATITTSLIDAPIDFIRVHNVEMCARAVKTKKSLEP